MLVRAWKFWRSLSKCQYCRTGRAFAAGAMPQFPIAASQREWPEADKSILAAQTPSECTCNSRSVFDKVDTLDLGRGRPHLLLCVPRFYVFCLGERAFF